jgi:DNA-binding MarR family transcriptional regulator
VRDHRDPPVSQEAAIAELIGAIRQLFRRLRADANPGELSLSQAGALARLEEHGWMTTADLARAELVKPQSMGATLAGLEQEGLVQRRPHPTDGRQVLFGLTDQGRANRRRRALLKREWLSAAMAKLDPEERRTLISVIPLMKRLGEP